VHYFWESIELYSYQERTITPIVIYNLLPIILHLFFLVKFGGSPGKILVKIKVVNQYDNYLAIRNALLRFIPFLLFGLLAVLQQSVAIYSFLPEEVPLNQVSAACLILKYGNVFLWYIPFGFLLVIVDTLTILFNIKKRAIHDYIAGSYVIKR